MLWLTVRNKQKGELVRFNKQKGELVREYSAGAGALSRSRLCPRSRPKHLARISTPGTLPAFDLMRHGEFTATTLKESGCSGVGAFLGRFLWWGFGGTI